MGPGGGTMVRGRVVWSAVAGLAATGALVFWRGFFWHHAVLIGIAVTILVYSGLNTFERLKNLHRRR